MKVTSNKISFDLWLEWVNILTEPIFVVIKDGVDVRQASTAKSAYDQIMGFLQDEDDLDISLQEAMVIAHELTSPYMKEG